MPTIEQYLPWVASGPAFVWTTDPCSPGWWLVAIHGLSGGSLTDMREDPDHVGPGENTWQLLTQVDAGVGLPKWRVWARKVTASGTYRAGFPGPDSGLDIYSHFLVISGLRDAEDASDVFMVGAETGSGTVQAVASFQPDDTGSNLVFSAWMSGAVANYTIPGALSANSELDGAASTSGSGTGSKTGYGIDTFTATSTVSAPWAAVTVVGRAPSAGSVTFPAEPLRMRAEIAPGADPGQDPAYWAGLWTDISADVWMRNGGVAITRGRQDETSSVTPSSMALTVNNESGQFVRLNPNSPYFGLLTKNLPIQLWVDPGDGWRLRYRGFVSEFPPRSQGGQVDEHMPLQAAGVTRRLSRGRVLQSPINRAVTGGLIADMAGYWPLESSLLSGIPGKASLRASGAVSFGSGGPPGSAGAASLATDAKLSATVTGMANTGAWLVSFWVDVPADLDASNSGIMVNWQCGGMVYNNWYAALLPDDPGHVTVTAFDAAGAWTPAVSVEDLRGLGPQLVTVMAANTGGAVRMSVYVGGSGVLGPLQPITDTLAPITAIGVNGFVPVGTSTGGSVSHIIVSATDPGQFDIPGYTGPLNLVGTGYVGERAADRIRRIGAEEGVPIVVIGDDGASELMGPQPVDRFLNILQNVEDADGGMLYERRDGRLGYQTRNDRFNAAPAITLPGMAAVAPAFEPTDDDQHIRNDVTVSRDGGGSARVIDEDHITANGQYADNATVNVADDDQLPDLAGWRVHEGTAEGLRYPSIAPNLNGQPNLIPAWSTLDVGQPLTLTNPGRDLPPGTINTVIEGYKETIDVVSWTATANCTPGDTWRVIVLDDTELGRLDTAGSALNSSATSTATSISVATTSGPLWTTRSSDRPFDINVGGEQMTVTNVTGTSSPQTMTVTRSINGVVKAHVAGEDVRLAITPVLSF